MIYLAIFLLFILLILLVSYPIKCFLKFSFLDKLTKNKYLKLLICCIPIIIVLLIFGFINSIIVLLHLSIFLFLVLLILLLYQKITKKDLKKKKYFKRLNIIDIRNIVAVIITIIYLGIGMYLDFHVFETKYTLYTNKDINDFRIIQIADSHVGTTFDGNGFYKYIEKISKIDMDIFVITGDFVDDDTTLIDMKKSCEAFKLLKPKKGIYYVFGNHDRGYYNNRDFNEEDLIRELEKNGVKVLRDEVVELDNIYIIGREDKSRTTRKKIQELTKDLDKNKYMIVLNHQPNDYENESKEEVDLVLSGHSHGGQMWPIGPLSVIVGSNDEYYGHNHIDKTDFIVTSGISNWALYFKTGAKSEYVIIDIKKK